MKRTFTLVSAALLLFTAKVGFAQQDPQFTMNMFNRLYVNPAYAGSNNGICANALHRQQWVGFAGRPMTTVVSVDGTVKALHGGLGLSFLSDKLGAQYSGGVKLAYAFRLNLGPGTLGIGLEGGILFSTLDGSLLTPVQQNDPNIVNQSSTGLAPDLGAGVYYHTDKLYFGVSANHLLASDVAYESGSTTTNYKYARHYFAMAGYTYDMTPTLALKPSVFLKTDGAATQFDLNVSVMWNQMVWGGVSYRIDDAVAVMAGVQFGEFRVGYSYDITTSKLNSYSSGSHEVMLGYCYKFKTPTVNQRYGNVRFL
jgi:type IX secretion system PorP/SprF family membrane protein